MKKIATRSSNKLVLNQNKQIPLENLSVVDKFYHTKLSSLKDVLALVFNELNNKISFKSASRRVAKLIEVHWTERNIYTISFPGRFKTSSKRT